ncbi:MAG TPA: condensation domain-containing protein, partial [Thermoanaerobaculia bacterium]
DQVKIRGFRIEPGEIQAVLDSHPGVREAVVLALAGADGDRRLAAWVVPALGAAPPAIELWRFLRERLPAHMVPADFVSVPSLPLTVSGKVDRRALPPPQAFRPDREGGYEPPRDPVEEVLAGIWSHLLHVGRIGRRDSFFELGGHSLMASRVTSRVAEAFGVELPLRALFEAPTVAALAKRVESALAGGDSRPAPPLVRSARTEASPLSFAQERLWFLDQLEPGSALYNLPAALRLTGQLDVSAFGRSLAEIVRRHEVLRTVFQELAGEPRQVVMPPAELPLPVVDLGALAAAARGTEAVRLAQADASRPFDLARGPLLRASLVRLADESWIALWNLHHIVGDGWSLGVLVDELAALYTAFSQGGASPRPAESAGLAELPIQYADFAIWQREWLKDEVLEAQISYWKEELKGAPTLLALPGDRPRPPVQSFRGASEPVRLPVELTGALKRLGQQQGGTLFMTLLSGFSALLSRLSYQPDVLVGTAVANRTRLETEGLVGFFVNTLVLRGRLAESPSFGELLGRMRRVSLGAYAHQDLPFEKLVEELEVPRSLSHGPLCQVMFVLQ